MKLSPSRPVIVSTASRRWTSCGRARARPPPTTFAKLSTPPGASSDPANGPGYLVSENESIALCPKESSGWTWRPSSKQRTSPVAPKTVRLPGGDRAVLGGAVARRPLRGVDTGPPRGAQADVSFPAGRDRQALRGAWAEELEPAVQALQRVLAEEPTNEEAHVGLMRLYASSGSQEKPSGSTDGSRKRSPAD